MTSHLEGISTSSSPFVRRRARAAPLHRSLGAPAALWLVFRLYQIALGCSGGQPSRIPTGDRFD